MPLSKVTTEPVGPLTRARVFDLLLGKYMALEPFSRTMPTDALVAEWDSWRALWERAENQEGDSA